jgi:hypothetical protein
MKAACVRACLLVMLLFSTLLCFTFALTQPNGMDSYLEGHE